ncbi:MAG TPA: hypothetical protein VIK70_10405 [Lysobacter sp.]
MNRLIAVFYFVLSLYGFDVGSTIVHRINVDGSQALHSKVVAQPGVARFECLRSASGRCYYTLYPRECASKGAAAGRASVRCPSGPVRHFAIANGDSREIAALPRFRLCVSTEDGTPGPDCEAPEPIAAR